jgi:serine protease Do
VNQTESRYIKTPLSKQSHPREVWLRTALLAAALFLSAPLLSQTDTTPKAISESGKYPVSIVNSSRGNAPAPGNVAASFKAIQQQIEAIRPGLIRSTVAIRAGNASGSGVILTSDGLVLTAAHVISDAPGRRLSITLEDGRRFPATFVGADPGTDLGLIQATNAKDLPVAPLGDSSTLRPGQWILAAGHPLGQRTGRPPVLRIGRVLGQVSASASAQPRRRRNSRRITTDAPLINGDSGGPLYDLNGRVVGINSMITAGRRMESIHSPVNMSKAAIEAARHGETPDTWSGPPSLFAFALSAGQEALTTGDAASALRSAREAVQADASSAAARLLLAQALARNGRRDAAVTALQEAIERGYNDAEAIRNDRDLAALTHSKTLARLLERLDVFNSVPGVRKGDQAFLTAASDLTPRPYRSVVRVRADGKDVALGTVMSANGDILTKASELPDGVLECVLPDGQTVPATRRGVDSTWDVALLNVRASGLKPVSTAEVAQVGLWTFSPDNTGSPTAIGMVGVADMPVRGRGIGSRPTSKAYMGAQLEPVEPQGVRVEVAPDMPASRAGIATGDIILEADGKTVRDPDMMMDLLVSKKPGDTLKLRLARGEDRLDVTVNLGTRPAGMPGRGGIPEMLSGDLSRMSGPFTRVLHHDAILTPNAMGGPVLDTNGKCIGINIARADRTSTYAIEASDVQAIYKRLKNVPASVRPSGS